MIFVKLLKINVANNIYKYRKANNLTSQGLSDALKSVSYYCAASTIRAWESGHKTPTIYAIAALCSLFEVSSDELLF